MNAPRLILGDSRAVIPTLGRVSAVITDPPYGCRYLNKRGDIRPHISFAGPINGDECPETSQSILSSCFQRGWPVCAFAGRKHLWQGPWRQTLIWNKGGAVGGGGDPATCWKFTWEFIQVGGFGRLNGPRESAVLNFPIGQNSLRNHPTEKPVELLRHLIRKLTQPGDVIFDPFMGSGSTAVAALLEGREFVGVEIAPEYHAVALARVEATLSGSGRMATA